MPASESAAESTNAEWVRIYSPAGEQLSDRYVWRSPVSRALLVPGMTVLDWKQEDPEYKLVLFRDPVLSVKWEQIHRTELIEHLRKQGIVHD